MRILTQDRPHAERRRTTCASGLATPSLDLGDHLTDRPGTLLGGPRLPHGKGRSVHRLSRDALVSGKLLSALLGFPDRRALVPDPVQLGQPPSQLENTLHSRPIGGTLH